MPSAAADALWFDSHMHTPLCKHAYGEPEEYAERALEQNLRGIIFTCHSPMPRGFWQRVRMGMDEFPTYLALVQRAKEAYAGRLEVLLGIESDYFPGFEDWIAELHGMAPFHYCLGSVHWQGKEYMERYGDCEPRQFYETYFDLLAASAETGLFDCLAHPDLVKNYHPEHWDFDELRPVVAAALDRIATAGVAMEINTSGLHKRYSAMNPGPDMLAMMAERRIPVVVGSDSHVSRRVAENFPLALRNLQTAGYSTVSRFENRQRQDHPITEVLASLPQG